MRNGLKRTALGLLVILSLFLVFSFWARLPQISKLPGLVRSNVAMHGATYVSLSQIPAILPQALIDTEDQSFYTNPGISIKGIGRSLITDLVSQEFKEGASTLTQQLVRQYYLSPQKTISRKLKEAFLAIIVTQKFSKDSILEMYLNSVYFGHGAWGIDAAADIYFGKAADELNASECTLLAGLPQAPSYLDPYANYEEARKRQMAVLKAMARRQHLSENQINDIMAMPLTMGR